MNNTLEILNFGPEFRKWVNIFFNDRWTYILLQNFPSNKITLKQGVPQGDVLSPYIFNICVEILLIKITKTNSLEGITIAKEEARAETYADETTIIIKRNEENLRTLIRIIQDFSKLSGLQANLKKTSVTPIGGNFSIEKEDQICQDLKLDWKKEFTLLGILIDGELKKIHQNFEAKIIKAKTIITNWKNRPMSIHRRITVACKLILSQFTYIATILNTNDENLCSRVQN